MAWCVSIQIGNPITTAKCAAAAHAIALHIVDCAVPVAMNTTSTLQLTRNEMSEYDRHTMIGTGFSMCPACETFLQRLPVMSLPMVPMLSVCC